MIGVLIRVGVSEVQRDSRHTLAGAGRWAEEMARRVKNASAAEELGGGIPENQKCFQRWGRENARVLQR